MMYIHVCIIFHIPLETQILHQKQQPVTSLLHLSLQFHI